MKGLFAHKNAAPSERRARRFVNPQFVLLPPVQRPEILARAIVRALQILRAERAPGAGPHDLAIGHVVHTHRDAQHGAQRDQIRPDVPVAERAVFSNFAAGIEGVFADRGLRKYLSKPPHNPPNPSAS